MTNVERCPYCEHEFATDQGDYTTPGRVECPECGGDFDAVHDEDYNREMAGRTDESRRPVRLTSGRLRALIREEVQAASSSAAWRDAIDDLGSALAAVQVLESEGGASPLGPSAMKMVHDLHLAVTRMEGF